VCIVRGGRVQNSAFSPNVRIKSYADVRESTLLENIEIGRHCRIRKAIIDKDVYIPAGATIGYDAREDKKRFPVCPGGVAVIPGGAEVR
jgi:glucose-1-phosphate adenylyltransferase